MEKIVAFMEKNIVPIATKIGQQRHLIAIRNGFLGMLALTMLSSICTLITNMPIEPAKVWLETSAVGQHILAVCKNISWGCFSFMSIFACFGIADSLWKSYDKKGLEAAFVAVGSFIAISPQTVKYVAEEGAEPILVNGGLAASNYGASSLFTAILIAIISVELLRVLYAKESLKIKLPDAVPPAVAKSFEAMIPGMITLTVMIVLAYGLQSVTGMYLTELITSIVQTPLQGLTNSLASAILIPFGNSAFWTLGLHGNQIMNPITTPLLTALSAENMHLASIGATEGYNVITSPFFFAFAWHGGSGATIGLLIAMIIGGKKVRERNKAITTLAMGPGIFNINEPVIFGVPIVLNPIYAIPFILAPVINSVIAYVAIDTGLVAPTIVQSIPWVTPAVMSGFLATGKLSGALLSGFTFVLSIFIYLPFVKASLAMEEKQMANKMKENANAQDLAVQEVAMTSEVQEETTKVEKVVKEEKVANIASDREIKIMLACAGGMSTSLLAKKMQDTGRARGENVTVWAIGIGDIPRHSGEYDVLLLGPQVKISFNSIREEKADKDKPVELIEMKDYGSMNAQKVLERAYELIGLTESAK